MSERVRSFSNQGFLNEMLSSSLRVKLDDGPFCEVCATAGERVADPEYRAGGGT